MRISSLFDIITDAQDVLDFFDRVESPEQLVSRLDRLKRQGSDELLACIEGLRGFVATALQDTLEMNASLGEPDTSPDDDLDLDAELEGLAEENVNPASSLPTEDAKKDDPPTT